MLPTGRAGHPNARVPVGQAGTFLTHQRALYSLGTRVDTGLQCTSGEASQQVAQRAGSRRRSQGGAEQDPKGQESSPSGTGELETWRLAGAAWGGAGGVPPRVAPCQGTPAVLEDQGRTKQPALLTARKLLTWRTPVDDRQMQGMPGPTCLLPRPAGT